MLFHYKVQNAEGELIEGVVEANDETMAADILSEKNFQVVSLVAKSTLGGAEVITMGFFAGKVKAKDLVVFARQLSVLISATVPMVQALTILHDQTSNKALKIIMNVIKDDVDGGMKLSEALARHPKVFGEFYVNMVKAGENSGKLDEVLGYLATQQEKDYDLNSKIKGAMMYPVFVISAMILVGIAMMIWVIPNMTQMLVEAGIELPLTTRMLIATSGFLQSYWWLLPILFGGVVVGIPMILKTPHGKLQWDSLKTKLPVFGHLLGTIYLVRFTRSLKILLTGGVPLAQALEIVAGVVGNELYRSLLMFTTSQVRQGNTMSSVFLDSKLFPSTMSNMISVGEQTGKLDDVLERLTIFYEREVETLTSSLTTLIEPIILVVMGVGVGGLVMAIMVPMMSLVNAQS